MRTAASPVLLLIVCWALAGSQAYEVGEVRVKVNSPKGFEVSVDDEPGISLFAFHGKLNKEMDDLGDQTWATDIVNSRDGRWTYRNQLQKLQPGDILYYWVTVRYNGIDYHKYNQYYKVGEDDDKPHKTTINLTNKNGTLPQIIVNGNPTINIYVS